MSIAISILEMAEAEAAAQNCARVTGVTVHYGKLAGIMPEALELAFAALTATGPHAGASLTLVKLPLVLRCPFCGKRFTPAAEDLGQTAIFAPCPQCSEEFGHIVEQGRELILARVEAE